VEHVSFKALFSRQWSGSKEYIGVVMYEHYIFGWKITKSEE